MVLLQDQDVLILETKRSGPWLVLVVAIDTSLTYKSGKETKSVLYNRRGGAKKEWVLGKNENTHVKTKSGVLTGHCHPRHVKACLEAAAGVIQRPFVPSGAGSHKEICIVMFLERRFCLDL